MRHLSYYIIHLSQKATKGDRLGQSQKCQKRQGEKDEREKRE